eukprot:7286259-Lingulodinium_polyedra.AAC.1
MVEEAVRELADGLRDMMRSQEPVFDQRSLGRLQDFSGKDEDWALWSFVLEAHVARLNMDASTWMENAATHPTEIRLDTLPDAAL